MAIFLTIKCANQFPRGLKSYLLVYTIHCPMDLFLTSFDYRVFVSWSSVKMADRDVLELANDEEFGEGGMDDMDGEV